MIVSTPTGPVAGRVIETPHGIVSSFLGLPYAEIGPMTRFRVATPPRQHREVRDASSAAPAVPQTADSLRAAPAREPLRWSETGSLTANVWSPENAQSLPVMVWVHGGGYIGGSNSSPATDGSRLAAAGDVVVVALSYRLGVFGFLPAYAELGEGFEDAANLGILDLISGLEWVRENVSAFGGDPDAVTVFGQSAGAAAVGTMLGMPRARGLFRRAIMQSGTAERVRTPDEAAEVSERFLHASGLTPRTGRDLLSWPAERLLDVQSAFRDDVARTTVGLPLPYQPVMDGRSILQSPLDAIRAGASGDVDLIVGTNLDEGSFFTTMGDASGRTDAQLTEAIHTLVRNAFPSADPEVVASAYRAELADTIGRVPTLTETVESFVSDVQYRQPSNRLLDARAGSSGRTFSYLFSWPSPTVPALGSCHTLELPFVLRQLDHPDNVGLVGERPPLSLSAAMSHAWSSFAATGVPAVAEPSWPEYLARRETMLWDREPTVTRDPRGGLRTWWTRLLSRAG